MCRSTLGSISGTNASFSFSSGNARYGKVLMPTPSSSIAINEIMLETNNRLCPSKHSASVPASSCEVPLRTLGTPYSDADIAGARDAVKGKTEMDALVAYLQGLGTIIKSKR